MKGYINPKCFNCGSDLVYNPNTNIWECKKIGCELNNYNINAKKGVDD